METQPTRLVLIRHGESHSNAHGWISGQDSCKGLTDLGVAQAEALRERLVDHADLRPDRIVVSTMRRAVHTAEIVARAVGIAPDAIEQRAELIERTSGECEGMTIEAYVEAYGKRPWSDWTNPLSPGGESGDEFLARVRSATDRLAAESAGGTTWVVCHGGVIMATATARWPGAKELRIGMGVLPIASPLNTSLSEWVIGDDADDWTMRRYNDHAHLERLGVTDAPAPI